MEPEELWDVLDKYGHPTGETIERSRQQGSLGMFHRVVATCLVRSDGYVLMTQRSPAKSFPLAWEFPGGCAMTGETSVQAARRELREETGLIVDSEAFALVGQYTEGSAICDVYVARITIAANLELDPAEVCASEWIHPEEVRHRLTSSPNAVPWAHKMEPYLHHVISAPTDASHD